MRKRFFRIAEHNISVSFVDETANDTFLSPSFEPFEIKEADDGCIFSLNVHDSIKPYSKEQRERIGIFETGNGKTIVDRVEGGGYQFLVKGMYGCHCCLLQTNSDFSVANCALKGSPSVRSFGLNTAIMMMYAFRGGYYDTLLIHASVVRNNGYAYAFTAQSGTGKSTHTSLWIKSIEGCDLINDDNPVVRIIGGKAFVYGSPWSGKTPCYRNVKVALDAIVKIERAGKNSIERVSPVVAFTYLVPACSSMKWDSNIFGHTCDVVTKLIESFTSVYKLRCLPNEEAAKLCYEAIAHKPNDNGTDQ